MSSIKSLIKQTDESSSFLRNLRTDGSVRILVAFSGGPDSLCLLHFLSTKCTVFGWELSAAYFNHNLRSGKEIERELRHVASCVENLGIHMHVGRAEEMELSRFAQTHRISIEESARIKRYEFLRYVADCHNYDYIAVGHTQDDQLETLIQRFFQGAGIRGLSGIPRINGKIIRPLLAWRRNQILRYLQAHGLESFSDTTNMSKLYLRNRIRHSIIPVVEEVFGGYDKALISLSEKMWMARSFVDSHVEGAIQWKREQNGFSAPLSAFVDAHPIVRIESVRVLFDKIMSGAQGTMRLPFRFTKSLVSLKETTNNKVLLKGNGLCLRIRGHSVFCSRDVVLTGEKGYFIVVTGDEENGWSIHCDQSGLHIERRLSTESRPGGGVLPAHCISFPLIIRSRREGDEIHLFYGKKSLKKLYNEWKVPQELRWMIPVCEDTTGVIAVLGSVLGFSDRFCRFPSYAEASSVLKLSIVDGRQDH